METLGPHSAQALMEKKHQNQNGDSPRGKYLADWAMVMMARLLCFLLRSSTGVSVFMQVSLLTAPRRLLGMTVGTRVVFSLSCALWLADAMSTSNVLTCFHSEVKHSFVLLWAEVRTLSLGQSAPYKRWFSGGSSLWLKAVLCGVCMFSPCSMGSMGVCVL